MIFTIFFYYSHSSFQVLTKSKFVISIRINKFSKKLVCKWLFHILDVLCNFYKPWDIVLKLFLFWFASLKNSYFKTTYSLCIIERLQRFQINILLSFSCFFFLTSDVIVGVFSDRRYCINENYRRTSVEKINRTSRFISTFFYFFTLVHVWTELKSRTEQTRTYYNYCTVKNVRISVKRINKTVRMFTRVWR